MGHPESFASSIDPTQIIWATKPTMNPNMKVLWYNGFAVSASITQIDVHKKSFYGHLPVATVTIGVMAKHSCDRLL